MDVEDAGAYEQTALQLEPFRSASAEHHCDTPRPHVICHVLFWRAFNRETRRHPVNLQKVKTLNPKPYSGVSFQNIFAKLLCEGNA